MKLHFGGEIGISEKTKKIVGNKKMKSEKQPIKKALFYTEKLIFRKNKKTLFYKALFYTENLL